MSKKKEPFNFIAFIKTYQKIIIIAFIVLVLFSLTLMADLLFPGTALAIVINDSIGKFFNIMRFVQLRFITFLESATIIFFVWLIASILILFTNILSKKNQQRETIGLVLTSIIKYGSFLVVIFLILNAWGVEAKTLLAGAGIIGLALSFGAQSLIEDVLSGVFIIFEKQFEVGSVVELEGFRGNVVEIGIRVTKIMDINEDIKIVHNSDIRGIVNMSSKLSPAICDISVGYGADLKKIEAIIIDHLPSIKESIKHIKEGPFYRGVQELGTSSVVLRILAKTPEIHRFQVIRDLNREMKLLFDSKKIEIPFPQIVVHQVTKSNPE